MNKRKITISCFFIVLLLCCSIAVFAQSGSNKGGLEPVNEAASDSTKAVLNYLGAISRGDIEGTIVGQNCFHGDDMLPTRMNGYHNVMTKLFEKTGKWPGMMGVDYAHDHIYSPQELSQANKYLIDYWNKGGLISINFSPLNPWILQETGGRVSPESWNGKGSTRDKSKVDLRELVTPGNPAYFNWHNKLDRMANALLELQAAGVVVLWRPMQEMNGDWFWWGNATQKKDANAYRAVWEDMYNYFTKTKGLDNLLWVYSPAMVKPYYPNVRKFKWAYPGDHLVDIVSGTSYTTKMDQPYYSTQKKMGKPFGMGEYGSSEVHSKKGTLDNRVYSKRIQKNYKGTAYFMAWHSYPQYDSNWSIITNKNSVELMNDPYVITRERIDWRSYLPKK